MKTLIFDAPANHLLAEGGKEIRGGDEFQVSDQRAVELLASDVPVREAESDLRKQTRPALDRLAEKTGVSNPGALPTKDAVIAAINQASTGSLTKPEADDGEGQHTTKED